MREKLEFCLLMGRYSTATIGDCQRLLRFASTLRRINSDEEKTAKKIRVQRKVVAVSSGFTLGQRFDRDGSVKLILHEEQEIEVPA